MKKPTKHEKPGIGGANVMIDFTHDWPLRLITTAEMPPPTAGTNDDDVYNVYACASQCVYDPNAIYYESISRSGSEAEMYRSKRYFLMPSAPEMNGRTSSRRIYGLPCLFAY
jgi:hypothetical protein